MASKQPIVGYVPCPVVGCNEPSEVRKFARTTKNEHWLQCPCHGKIEGRISNAKATHDYIMQHLVESPDQLSQAQPAPEPAPQQVQDEFTPDAMPKQMPGQDDGEPDETESPDPDPKPGKSKLGIGLALAFAGLLLILKGGK